MEALRNEAGNVVDLQGLQKFIGLLNKNNINSLFDHDGGETTPLIFAILSILYIKLTESYGKKTPVDSFNKIIEDILVIEGIDVDKANEKGETALMVAVKENSLEITKMLLKNGANVKKKDKRGMTALMKVRNNVDMVNALIEKKENINEMDNDGNTALSHYVAYSAGNDQIKTLIEKGADVNAGCYNLEYSRYYNRNNDGREYSSSTPLMNVIVNYTGDTGLVELMLSKGADVNLFDSEGKTAIDYCFRRKDWKDLLDVILQYTKTDKIERKQYNLYDYDKLLYLYEKNIIPYNEDKFKRFISSTESNEEDEEDQKAELLEKMLELGIKKFLGKTPQEKPKDDIIVCAAILEKPDKVEQLLKDGADVNVKFFYKNFRNGVN
jgi:ankyrin repeat protein